MLVFIGELEKTLKPSHTRHTPVHPFIVILASHLRNKEGQKSQICILKAKLINVNLVPEPVVCLGTWYLHGVLQGSFHFLSNCTTECELKIFAQNKEKKKIAPYFLLFTIN